MDKKLSFICSYINILGIFANENVNTMNYKEFFYFQKSDRSVLIVLLVLAVIVSVLLYGVGGTNETTPLVSVSDSSQWKTDKDSSDSFHEMRFVGQAKTNANHENGYYRVEEQVVERFPFDPNTADSMDLLRLGLKIWQVKSIYRYRAKGGIYREPKDFARLYGLTVKQYRELEPYIRISKDYQPASTLFENEKKRVTKRDTFIVRSTNKLKENERIDLNELDTSSLKKVPGVGNYYAQEIARYGHRLGGYVSVKQLYEIEDLPEEVMKYFEIHQPRIRKMNLNKFSLRQLRTHPYLNFYQCKAILDYRRLKGPLKSMDELRMMKEFTPQDIERLRPYVEF